MGKIPLLVDGEWVVSDSCAILVYLAKTCAPNSHWLTDDILPSVQTQRWLAIATGEIKCSCAIATLWGGD